MMVMNYNNMKYDYTVIFLVFSPVDYMSNNYLFFSDDLRISFRLGWVHIPIRPPRK